MHDVVKTVFSRLHELDPVAEENKLLANSEDSQETEVKMSVPVGVAVGLGISEETSTAVDSEADLEEPEVVPVETPAVETSVHRSNCKHVISF